MNNDRRLDQDSDQDENLQGKQSDYGTSERANITTGTTGGLAGKEEDDELVRSKAGRTDAGNPTTSDSDDIDESDSP